MKKGMVSFMLAGMLISFLAIAAEARPASIQRSSETRRVYVYQDGSSEASFRWIPEGYMPGGTGIALKTDAEDRPFEGKTCVRVRFNLEGSGWRGVYWLAAGWKPVRRGPNLFELLGIDPNDKGMGVRLVFHARSDKGAGVQFKVGGIREGEYPDSLSWPVESEWIQLSPQWTRYSLDLSSRDLSCVQGGFCFVANDTHNTAKEIEFLIDEVYFEAFVIGR